MKLILHHFKYSVRLRLDDSEFENLKSQLVQRALSISSPEVLEELRKIEENALNIGKPEVSSDSNENSKDKAKQSVMYNKIWESEIYRLRGKVLMEC